MISAPVLIAVCVISVWLCSRKKDKVKFKDFVYELEKHRNMDEVSAAAMSYQYGNFEPKDWRRQSSHVEELRTYHV